MEFQCGMCDKENPSLVFSGDREIPTRGSKVPVVQMKRLHLKICKKRDLYEDRQISLLGHCHHRGSLCEKKSTNMPTHLFTMSIIILCHRVLCVEYVV